MKMRALVFKGALHNSSLGIELTIDRPADLENVRQQPLPRAYLLCERDLGELRKYEGLIVDRGVKNKAKPLSDLLLGHKQFPLIEGSFKSTQQVRRSIDALLTNANKKQDRNAYFIGVKGPIFDQLWQKAKAEGRAPGEGGSGGAQRLEDFPEVSSWMVQELSTRCQVSQYLMDRYVGVSDSSMLVRQMIVLAAASEKEVLITGDTGTGKEVVAKEIHAHSSRKDKCFLPINCSGIPTTLLESELFGYEKGAFTGASKAKEGLWKLAGEGTLFLDEIGDLHIESQAKILRALEDGKIRPLGGKKLIDVHARVIAATNRDLSALVEKGEFREDLYHRLLGFRIPTPSLRHHVEDIPVLADFFWKKITDNGNNSLPKEVVDHLKSHRWPGNVREIKKVLENLYSLFGSADLRLDHLRAVFYLEGQEIPWKTPKRAATPGLKKKNIEKVAAGLYHMKRAQEVIRHLEIQFTRMKAQKERSLDVAFKFGVYELESLCRHPSLFGNCFTAVWGLLESLNRYLEPVQADNRSPKAQELEISEAFEKVQATLSNEIKHLVASLP